MVDVGLIIGVIAIVLAIAALVVGIYGLTKKSTTGGPPGPPGPANGPPGPTGPRGATGPPGAGSTSGTSSTVLFNASQLAKLRTFADSFGVSGETFIFTKPITFTQPISIGRWDIYELNDILHFKDTESITDSRVVFFPGLYKNFLGGSPLSPPL